MSPVLLDVQDLRVRLKAGTTEIAPVDGVSFSVARGEALGIVGESGSGKSLTLKAILGLLPVGSLVDGSLRFSVSVDSVEEVSPDQMRGRGVSMIFQEPMTALNPTMRACLGAPPNVVQWSCSTPSGSPTRRSGHECGRTSCPGGCASGS